MRRYTRVCVFTLSAIVFNMLMTIGCAQTIPRYSFQFDQRQMIDALNEIEKATNYTIYYKAKWIDSLQVSGVYNNLLIQELFDSLLRPHNINYTILDHAIILTGDVKIVELLVYDSTADENQSKYIFEREYKGNANSETFVIGNRSLMKIDGLAVITGFVLNQDSGEAVENAVVYDEISEISAITNSSGLFSLNLPTGDHTLVVRYSGMRIKRQRTILFSDGSVNFYLNEEPRVLDEVMIISDQNANVSNTRMGSTSLNMESLKNMPKILGENDIIQVALTLPGVQNVGEGSAGINVRGGKADQNLILLNNATIYNPFHFFGFFSSFNADVTSSSELLKSAIPASSGGRLSSLLNVKMKKADKDHFGAKLGINPITSKASFEVPIVKGRTALMAGFRTTYSDWVISRVPNDDLKNSNPFFADMAVNLDHSYGENNSINVSAYYSKDRFRLSTDSTTRYDNLNASVEWSHLLTDKLSSTFIAGFGTYQFSIDYASQPESAFDYSFKIQERFGKWLLNYFPNDKHSIQIGTDAKLYNLQPGQLVPTGISDVNAKTLQTEKGLEYSLNTADDFKLTPKISISAGLRYSFFSPFGDRLVNQYEPNTPKSSASLLSTQVFFNGEVIDTYHGPEVRLSGNYSLSSSSSLKVGITQMRQYIHSITNTVSVSPTDTWKLSDPNFAPEKSIQYSIGYYKNLYNDNVQLSIESYYKNLDNILDYKVGADLVLNEALETDIVQGKGRAYGLEFLLRKPAGKLNGWLSYTYSRSLQKFDSKFPESKINNGNYFSSNFDKPHYLSLVANYKYTRRYSFSMNVIHSSGRPVTYPTGKYSLGGTEITHFSNRNGYRIPNYFRVDLSINVEGSHRLKKLGHGYWSFSVYNLLARKNVYSIFFTNNGGTIKGYKLSVLGTAIPSITYNIKF